MQKGAAGGIGQTSTELRRTHLQILMVRDALSACATARFG